MGFASNEREKTQSFRAGVAREFFYGGRQRRQSGIIHRQLVRNRSSCREAKGCGTSSAGSMADAMPTAKPNQPETSGEGDLFCGGELLPPGDILPSP
jgi:hypothetical protein